MSFKENSKCHHQISLILTAYRYSEKKTTKNSCYISYLTKVNDIINHVFARPKNRKNKFYLQIIHTKKNQNMS